MSENAAADHRHSEKQKSKPRDLIFQPSCVRASDRGDAGRIIVANRYPDHVGLLCVGQKIYIIYYSKKNVGFQFPEGEAALTIVRKKVMIKRR